MTSKIVQEIQSFVFPCEKHIKELMLEHSTAVQENAQAHERLMNACQVTLKRPVNTFPELKDRQIVNPR